LKSGFFVYFMTCVVTKNLNCLGYKWLYREA
jgi:hypothetical protein